MKLTFAEWQGIAFDLRTAADKYTENATHIAVDHPGLAEQFVRQAQASIKMAERIEASEGV